MEQPRFLGVKRPDANTSLGAIDIFAGFGEDVDDTSESISPVNGRARSSDDLYAGDIVDRHSSPQLAPVADIQIRDRNIVDEHENLRIVLGIDAPDCVNGEVAAR